MKNLPRNHPGEFLLYETEDGRSRVECRFVADTLWLSQAGMAELFQTSKQNIAKHLKGIFTEGELVEDSVVNQWLTTAADGKNYRVAHDSVAAFGRGKWVICMDGLDLFEALDCELPLNHVLTARVQHAAETGIAFARLRDLFAR